VKQEQTNQGTIAGIGDFRCRLAWAEAAASSKWTPPAALLVFPRKILDHAEIPLRAVNEAGGEAAIGQLNAEQIGILLPGSAADQAESFANDIQKRLPAWVNGSCRAEVFVYRPGNPQADKNGRNPSDESDESDKSDQSDPSDPTDPSNPVSAGPVDPFAAAGDDPYRGLPPWKRALDLVGATAALVALSPLLGVLALGIKLVSPHGPVLFRQERIGYRGRRFTLLKFRSMHPNCDTDGHRDYLKTLIRSGQQMQKLDNGRDHRLIPLGKILRATALDELPQLFNVLRGDMSLVGPRPAIPYEYDEYEPWQKLRCNAAPGMTGLWQVSGKNNTTFTEMVKLDIRYSRTKSPGLDLKILFLTPRVIIAQVLDIVTRTGANAHERQTGTWSGWVRVLGPQSDT
jgi:lipopolysaccharide/colanic/teichoic acid biosynthesis glycosyltransferase